jgi:hypothetical protein
MRMLLTFALCALALVVLSSTAVAKPNYGVILNVHGNAGGVETNGDVCGTLWADPPTSCAELSTTALPDASGVEWFLILATREGYPWELQIYTVVFGLGPYDDAACAPGIWGPCNSDELALEQPSAGWPAPETGTAVSWNPNCQAGELVPLYYIGFYTYGGPGGAVPLGDYYPGQPASVVSCPAPGEAPEEDPIYAFGIIGCGDDPGMKNCDYPVPVEKTTWGQIKSIYQE